MFSLVKQTRIDFIGYRRIAYILSITIIAVGLAAFARRGQGNFGIDFTGGTIQQFEFKNPVLMEDIRSSLGKIGLGKASVQRFGGDKEIIIRTYADTSEAMTQEFKKDFTDNPFQVTRVEKVGPSVGKDLTRKALLALCYAMAGICLYVAMRFQFKYALAAIVALLHDVLVSVGALALAKMEISLPVIASLLTVVGYSINDTIVIFDRIREDVKLMRKSSLVDIMNLSINQTLSRTILTSFTVLLAVAALFLFGGEVIRDFSFVLLVGVIAGSYSTVFIASALVADWSPKK